MPYLLLSRKPHTMLQRSILVATACAMLIFAACKENTQPTTTAAPTNHGVPGDLNSAAHDIHYEPPTPADALTLLKEGNKRFLGDSMINTDYHEHIENTKDDQHPHSAILSCMDSRVPPEIVFDQGIGNVFVIRVAGNVEDADVLGSLEFAAKVKKVELILVMGHQNCGAVKGSIDNVKLGNLTQLLDHIKPAIALKDSADKAKMLETTAKNNVKLTIDLILKNSAVLSDLVKEGKLKLVGAYYHLGTGEVEFLD